MVSVESLKALSMTDLPKESILEFQSSTKVLDALRVDLGCGERDSAADRLSDGVFWMKVQAGLSLFLIM